MKSSTWTTNVVHLMLIILMSGLSFAGTTSKLSNIFTLDTQTENYPPINGWQILTHLGNSYHEDLVIDNQGKVWCFYFRSPGIRQPIYLKIFYPDGFIYKPEQVVGYGSGYQESYYNSIRAAANDSTGDIWVAIQGNNGGYVVIFDSTGNIRQDSTLLGDSVFSPKIARGKNGTMWFSWHTIYNGGAESQGKIAAFFANGKIYKAPTDIGNHTYIFNTDLAVDDSNRVWTVFEINQNNQFWTKYSIFNSNLSTYIDGKILSDHSVPVNPQRQIVTDAINQKVWILTKNTALTEQQLHLFSLNGTRITSISIRECNFFVNEKNFLEVVQFNDQNNLNKIYESRLYLSLNGEFHSSTTLFDSTFQFVRNGAAYNHRYPMLKVYAVQLDSQLTKLKFERVVPGAPEIAVKGISFDTTKISPTYRKYREVKVQNIGNAILKVDKIIPHDHHFSVSDTTFEILPQASRTIRVQFIPTTTDSIVDYLLFLTNDPNNDSLKVQVSGKGYMPTIPRITVDQDSLIFDNLTPGKSQLKYLYLFNDDLYEPLKVFKISTFNSQFTTPDSLGFTLNPKKGKYIAVIFKPTTVGRITGWLTISSNDTTKAQLKISLRGTCIQGTAQIAVQPDSLNFGEVALGHSRSMYLEIENKGNTNLNITRISAADTQFTVNQTYFIIPPFSKYYVLITYHVKRLELVRSTLTIDNSDSLLPHYIVNVTGVGRKPVAPTISVSEDTLSYGTIPVGEYKTQYFWIHNRGEEVLYIQDMKTNDRRFTIYQTSLTVNPGESKSGAVIFSPDTANTFKARLTIRSNDPVNDSMVVYLIGAGRNLSAPKIVLDPNALEFGRVATILTTTRTFTISNQGEQLLQVSKIELTAANPSFSIAPTFCNVPSGQYRTIDVTFSPKQIGEISATIRVSSNDPATATKTISLHGTGRAPNPQQIYVNPTILNFDTVAISRSKTLYLWLRNIGEKPLTVQNISSSDTCFKINATNFVLYSQQSQYVMVSFTPVLIKKYEAILSIQSDDSVNTKKYVTVTGFGRQLSNQNIQLSSTNLAFGEIPVAQQRILELIISNTGEKDLIISNVTNQKPVFSVDARNFTVLPQSRHTIYVNFNPQALTSYQDTLKITSNDPDAPLLKVLLTGTGRKLKDQKIVVSPDKVHFGQVGVGLSSSQMIKIRNDGEADLNVDSIGVKHANFAIKGSGTFILKAAESNWITVSFNPDHVDTFETRMTIFSNDKDSSRYQIPLTGYGRKLLEPNITFTPKMLNFGEVAIGRSRTINLEIGNNGEQELIVNQIMPNNHQFSVNPISISVRPDTSQLVSVTFQPLDLTTTTSKLQVISNDPDSSVAVVPVTGVGRVIREPQLGYNPQELNFGEVLSGDSLVKQITIQNTGDLPLFLFQVTTNNRHFSVNQDSIWIESDQQFVLNIKFMPDDTTVTRGSLTFRSNDPNKYLVQIMLQGKGKAHTQRIAISPRSLDFSQVLIHSSATKYFWVSNFGTTMLNIATILSTNKKFSSQTKSFTLEPGENQQVAVTFSPDSVKSYAGKLIVLSDDPVADSLFVLLTGTGRDSLAQQIAVASDSLYFGKVAVNNIKTQSLTIYNSGEKYLKVQKILVSDRVYSVNRTAFSVAPKSSENLDVHFAPTGPITYNDTLKIINNDPRNDTLIVKLYGIGREPNSQKIALSDTVLNFHTVPTDRSKSLSLWISNQGEKNLEISSIETNNGQFTVNESWFVLKPGQSHSVVVTFSPVKSDSISAILTIKNNDPNQPEKKVKLTGKGVFYTGPRISIQPSTLNFGNTLVGAIKKLALWISNASLKDTLKISKFDFSSGPFTILPLKLAVAPKDSKAVQVTFKPLLAGLYSTNVLISCNDKYQSVLDFWVSGSGMVESSGQILLANLGWKNDGYTPIGDFFSPSPHTDSLLSDSPDRAWFIKDFNLATFPDNAVINLCFDDEIQLFINGSQVLTENDQPPHHWNKASYNIKPFLKLGRNRVSILVWNRVNTQGGFDCECIVDGETKIKRGDQNWTHPDATWWYFGEMGKQYPTPPLDAPYNRLWFHQDYGLSRLDSTASRWVFEPSGSDTIYDSSPYGQKAILHNITWIPGIMGQAMQFSGQANSYVELYTNLNNIPLTIELWLKCYGAKSYIQDIITNKGTALFGHGLFVDTNMRLGIYYYNNDSSLTNVILQPNTWYFISAQYRSDTIKVYVNNKLEARINQGDGIPVGASSCYLGGNPSRQPSAFYGAIDELVIKNTALTPTPMPQVATISLIPPDTVNKQEALQFNFNIFPSPFKIVSGTFQYTWGGSNVYRTKVLSDPDSTFTSPFQIRIPPDSITVRGLKYSLNLQTNYGTIHYPDAGGYSWLEVTTSKESSHVRLPEKVHRMISVPYVLNNTSIASVLMDNLGDKNPHKWRLFEWDALTAKYVAYDDSNWQADHGFTPGRCYWLITSKPQTFDAGAGHSPANENFRIDLVQGWNMIANPFPYAIKWSDIEKTSSLISDPVYRETSDSIGWVLDVDRLLPWEGYFVYNGDHTSRSLIVPPKEAVGTSLKKQLSFADRYLEKYPDVSLLFAADVRCGRFMDRDNLFGAADHANDEYDQYDLKEAPAIGDFVSLSVDHSQWKQSPGRYTVDIRKSGADGYIWELTIDYLLTHPEATLEMKLTRVIDVPDNWLLYLFDLSEDIAIDLIQQSTVSIAPISGKEMSRKFRLISGTEEFVRQNSDNIPLIPLEFELFQNYPNPFNIATTICFNLPRRMDVTVKIYNIMGQLVTTLVDGPVRGGQHKIYWDGRNNQGNLISTGVYIIRLETSKQVAVKKLVVIK